MWVKLPFVVFLVPGFLLSVPMSMVLPATNFSNHGIDLSYALLGNLFFYTGLVYLFLRMRDNRMD